MAVTGGRNLCDEYFMRSARSNFFDYDAFVVGLVVSQVSGLFDEYWNAEQVWTAASAMRPEASAQELREAFNELISHKRTPEPQPFRESDRLGQMPLVDELQAGRVRLVHGLGQTDRTVQKRVGAAESLRL